MKLIVEPYLQELGERPELENLVVSLLEKMGLDVYVVPQKGPRQYGVDVAAVGIWPGDTHEAVHLLTIKAKDITRKNWDSGGVEDVRPSLNEIEDVYLTQRIRPQDKGKPIKVYICCGGRVRQEIDGNVTAFMTEMIKRHERDNLSVSVLDGSRLTSLLLQYLFDERVFVSGDQSLLKRCLATIDEPDLLERYFLELLSSVLRERFSPDKPLPVSQKMDCVCRLLLCLGVLVQEALKAKHLEGVFRIVERSVVYLLGYLSLDSDRSERAIRQVFTAISLYDRIALSYLESLEKLSDKQYLFALAVGGNEVDVNLRFFNVLARMAEYGVFLLRHYRHVEEAGIIKANKNLEKDFCDRINRVADCLCRLINNNTVARQPLEDSQHYAILLTLLFLNGVDRTKFAHDWVLTMVNTIENMFYVNKGYPTASLSYEDLLEHIEKPLSTEKQKQALRSGELYPSIALLAVSYKWDDVYDAVRRLVQKHVPNMSLQLWFMADEDMQDLCKLRGVNGHQLCHISLEDKDEFSKIIQLECESSKVRPTFMAAFFPSFFFVACRLNAVPVPASVWFCSNIKNAVESDSPSSSNLTQK